VLDNDRDTLARHCEANLSLIRADFDDLERVGSDVHPLPAAHIANGLDPQRRRQQRCAVASSHPGRPSNAVHVELHPSLFPPPR